MNKRMQKRTQLISRYKLSEDIELIDLALFFPQKKILIISDLHLGYEEALNRKGVLIPRFQFKDTLTRLKPILEQTKPETVIINGDLKHEFGMIMDQEWREILQLIDLINTYAKKIILIKGNHDVKLGPIARKRSIELVPRYEFDGYLVMHGDKIPEDLKQLKVHTLIIGNEHPAISIGDAIRRETYKCFLIGKFGSWLKKWHLIVLPSFNQVTIGTDVSKEQLLSPFLKENIKDCEVIVVDKELYHFGKVKSVK